MGNTWEKIIDANTYRIRDTYRIQYLSHIQIPSSVNKAYIVKKCHRQIDDNNRLLNECKHTVYFYINEKMVMWYKLTKKQIRYIMEHYSHIKLMWDSGESKKIESLNYTYNEILNHFQ